MKKTQIHITGSGLTIELAGMLITIEAKNAEITREGEPRRAGGHKTDYQMHLGEREEPTGVPRKNNKTPLPVRKTAAGYLLTCGQCGEEFTADRKKKYCSKSCAQKVYNKNYISKKQGEKKKTSIPYINPMTGRPD